MDAVLTALGEQHAELEALLTPLDDTGWSSPTRCEGWTVADVVLHLSQTDRLAIASAQGRFAEGLAVLAGGLERRGNVDDGAAAMVERERGLPDDVLHTRWRDGAAALRDELAAIDPHLRVDWVAGQLSIHTLVATRLAECWIHAGDVADAVGAVQVPTDRLEYVARLAWRTLPYAFARDGRTLSGPVAFHLRAPSGAMWDFEPDVHTPGALTLIEGDGVELCLVAARRVTPEATSLRGSGPDADAVLELVRTYA
jgi:uncharacterized protein (TIGR03084 family)